MGSSTGHAVGGIGGSQDVLRTPTARTEEDQRREVQRRAAARGNLAAWALRQYPAAWDLDPEALASARRWWADMLAALGLGEPYTYNSTIRERST